MGSATTPTPSGLLQRRLAAGLTQEQLGVAAGVTAKTIASIERGFSRPQRTTLEAIARALGCDADDLTGEQVAA